MMISLGTIRKTDQLGRITIPANARRLLNITPFDCVELFIEGEDLILHKYKEHCILCDNTEGLKNFKGKLICPDCIEGITPPILKII